MEQRANGWAFPETTPWPISGSGLQSGEEMRNVGNADFLCAYGRMFDPQRGGSPILQKPRAMPSLHLGLFQAPGFSTERRCVML
ncbi:MAG: hypothetical protein ACK5B6_02760, partial [Bacteroidia bacterium]